MTNYEGIKWQWMKDRGWSVSVTPRSDGTVNTYWINPLYPNKFWTFEDAFNRQLEREVWMFVVKDAS